MPVSAVFEMDQARSEFAFDLTMRLNGPSGIHLVVETQDGDLLVSEKFAKTSGQGACAAPRGTDPAPALESLGQMEFALVAAEGDPMANLSELGGSTAAAPVISQPHARRAAVSFSHPSHSGMQMDQITLLYLPARYIETVEVFADGQPVYTMTGSITLSENPVLTTDLPSTAGTISVRMTDTEGASFERDFHVGQG
jgi:sulfur-oxidizing protein SoxY